MTTATSIPSSPMTITFIDPITGVGTASGKPEYDPMYKGKRGRFSGIPDERGVYIWGMNVTLDGKDYFAPWCVGEGNLRTRLKDHYRRMNSKGDSNEELFDFSQATYCTADIKSLEASMDQYDSCVNSITKKGGTDKLDAAILVPKLIFWQDNRFLYHKCGTYNGERKYDIKHRSAIMPGGLLDTINASNHGSQALGLKGRIEQCKKNFEHGFYFIYWRLPEKGSVSREVVNGIDKKRLTDGQTKSLANEAKNDLRAVEHATKVALKQVGIPTTAEAYLEKPKNVGGYPGLTISLPSKLLTRDLDPKPWHRAIQVPAFRKP